MIMAKLMFHPKITTQEGIKIITQGLLRQGCRSVKHGGCVVNGPKGRHCALGFLSTTITDAGPVRQIKKLYPDLDGRMLDRVRRIHDDEPPVHWPRLLQEIADEY